MGFHTHHDETCADGLRAAVAQLAELGPVVLLAEEPTILLIVPVGQGGAAFTTPVWERLKTTMSLWTISAEPYEE